MHGQLLTIARIGALEAFRTRLPLMAILTVGLIWAVSAFVHEIAITESLRFQSSMYAALARLASVFMLALYLTSSIARDFQEKGLELMLALDLPRAAFILGKLLGFMAIAALLGTIACLPLLAWVPMHVVGIWGLTLFFELAIVAAASLFCIVTFNHVMPAVTLVAAFYLLARAIGAMRLIAETPLIGNLGGARPIVVSTVDALSYVLPTLDRFALTEWIAQQTVSAQVLGPIALQTLVYVTLLTTACLVDFYRREI